MLDLLSFTLPELQQQLVQGGFSPTQASRLWQALYRQPTVPLSELSGITPSLRDFLQTRATLAATHVRRVVRSADGLADKFLLGLSDGRQVEAVLMRFPGRVTACVSSQVGCALGCVFCATGQEGWQRDLTAGEIVAQVRFLDGRLAEEAHGVAPACGPASDRPARGLRGSRRPAAQRLRNVVLMGMGEPLLNYEAVMTACDILCDSAGLALAARRITVSTVGVIPGIVRLAEEERGCSLAVSLHAATQAERAALLPVARSWPLDELLVACRYYTRRLGRRIFFEWTLIDGINDTREHARQLAELLDDLPAHVNLIPLNPTSGYDGVAGTTPAARQFQAVLTAAGIPSTVRQRRGVEIAAGCGQLAGESASASQEKNETAF
ncbi:MAG: 23S rRNA (adenine(2503)-C(2))-methyltransferase RlmN [Pirellulales bacterium]